MLYEVITDPTPRNRDHHDAGGAPVARLGCRLTERLPQDPLFQAYAEQRREHSSADSADRARGNLEKPDSVLVDPHLRVHGPLAQADEATDARGLIRDALLGRLRQARWRDSYNFV